jgi:hypothetical protein
MLIMAWARTAVNLSRPVQVAVHQAITSTTPPTVSPFFDLSVWAIIFRWLRIRAAGYVSFSFADIFQVKSGRAEMPAISFMSLINP